MSQFTCDICGKDCVNNDILSFYSMHAYYDLEKNIRGLTCCKECDDKWMIQFKELNEEALNRSGTICLQYKGTWENEEIRNYKAESLRRLSRKDTRWVHNLKKSGSMRDLLQQRKQEKERLKR